MRWIRWVERDSCWCSFRSTPEWNSILQHMVCWEAVKQLSDAMIEEFFKLELKLASKTTKCNHSYF